MRDTPHLVGGDSKVSPAFKLADLEGLMRSATDRGNNCFSSTFILLIINLKVSVAFYTSISSIGKTILKD